MSQAARLDELAMPGVEIPDVVLLEKVAVGNFGRVYRGRYRDQPCVVKIQSSVDSDLVLRFRREGAILACLQSHAFPRVLCFGEQPSHQYIVMELVEGQTLEHLLGTEKRLGEKVVERLALDLGRALQEMHQRGFVHRDIKPGNIIISPDGRAWILDLGLAQHRPSQIDRHKVVGTLIYSAPEQSGMLSRVVDGRADLYSLGVLLYECLAGRPPFVAATATELMHMHATAAAEPLAKSFDVSPGLAAVVTKLLAKDPDDRYASAGELAADLGSTIASKGPPATAGRHRELREITAAWQKTLANSMAGLCKSPGAAADARANPNAAPASYCYEPIR